MWHGDSFVRLICYIERFPSSSDLAPSFILARITRCWMMIVAQGERFIPLVIKLEGNRGPEPMNDEILNLRDLTSSEN